MEKLFDIADIFAHVISYLNFSDMANLAQTSSRIRDNIKAMKIAIDSADNGTITIRGQITQYNFSEISRGLGSLGTIPTGHSQQLAFFARILLQYGTPTSATYLLNHSAIFASGSAGNILLAFFSQHRDLTGGNENHIVIDAVIIDLNNKCEKTSDNLEIICASALFAGHKYYFLHYIAVIRLRADSRSTQITSTYFGLFPIEHNYIPLSRDQAQEMIKCVRDSAEPDNNHTTGKIVDEIRLYSADVRDILAQTDDFPAEFTNIIALNQESADILDIIHLLFPAASPERIFLKCADFTRTDFGRNIFRKNYINNPDFIHEIAMKVPLAQLERVFPDIITRENILSGLARCKKSVLFPQIFSEKYDWLCDNDFTMNIVMQNVDAVNGMSAMRCIRGHPNNEKRACISPKYEHHALANISRYVDYISADAIIRYMEFCSIALISYEVPRVITLSLIPDISADNLRVIATINRVFDKIIENNLPYYAVVTPWDMKKVAEKFAIDLAGFIEKFRAKNIYSMSPREKQSHDNFVKKCTMFL